MRGLFCPMGCGETLNVVGGELLCVVPDCPNPRSCYAILAAEQHEHRVRFLDGHFTVRHPLRERVEGSLFDCTLNDWLLAQDGLPERGEFHAWPNNGGWAYSEVDATWAILEQSMTR